MNYLQVLFIFFKSELQTVTSFQVQLFNFWSLEVVSNPGPSSSSEMYTV